MQNTIRLIIAYLTEIYIVLMYVYAFNILYYINKIKIFSRKELSKNKSYIKGLGINIEFDKGSSIIEVS